MNWSPALRNPVNPHKFYCKYYQDNDRKHKFSLTVIAFVYSVLKNFGPMIPPDHKPR